MLDDYHHDLRGYSAEPQLTDLDPTRRAMHESQDAIRQQLADSPKLLRKYDTAQARLIAIRLRNLDDFLRIRDDVREGSLDILHETTARARAALRSLRNDTVDVTQEAKTDTSSR